VEFFLVRELHSFSDEKLARRFVHVLQSRKIPAHADQEGDRWVVWIENDDDRDPARKLLASFQSNPDSAEFSDAEKTVREQEKAAQQAAKTRQRLNIDIRDRWRGVWWKTCPATMSMIMFSMLVAGVCTDWKSPGKVFGIIPTTCNDEKSVLRNALFIQAPVYILPAPDGDVALFEPPSLMKTIRKGQIWRFVTPIFLHFHFLHILFNMMWLRDLGSRVEFARGTRRFLLLVIIIATVSNIAQLLWAGHYGIPFLAARFGGMSGVVFGLIGYTWMKGKTQPQQGLGMSPDQIVWAIFWMLLCIGGGFGNVANTVHVVGFLTGILLGVRQTFWKRFADVMGPADDESFV